MNHYNKMYSNKVYSKLQYIQYILLSHNEQYNNNLVMLQWMIKFGQPFER